MKRLTAGLLLATLGLAGCTKESKPGGPGAAPRTERSYQTPDNQTVTTDNKAVDSASTFTLKTTRGEVDLKRGESKELTISIDRGSKFNQQVELQLNAPSGLKVMPDKVTIPASEKEAKVTIEADADAPAGKVNIEATGMPTTGRSASLKIPVEVHAD